MTRNSNRSEDPAQSAEITTGRVPPHSHEAEQALLGGLMLLNRKLGEVDHLLKPEYFYLKSHRLIYEAMLQSFGKNEPIDYIQLKNRLSADGKLEAAGGAEYLADLTDLVATAGNLEAYARIVRDKALIRDVIEAGLGIVGQGFAEPSDTDEYLKKSLDSLFTISTRRSSKAFHLFKDVILDALNNIADYEKYLSAGVPTGFDDLDEKLKSFLPGQLIILAARPAMGKTSLALNMASNAARMGHPTAIFSLEMTKLELGKRMLCAEARLDSNLYKSGKLTNEQLGELAKATDVLYNLPIFIDDSAGISDGEIRAKAQWIKREHGLKLIVVDYLQLMMTSMSGNSSHNREQYISQISRNLKAIAKDLEVPVLCLSQLSRAPEGRTNKRPMMSDLRESGAIEQDADIVLFIYREEYYDPGKPEYESFAEVIIGKNRSGPTGKVGLRFAKEITQFQNLARDSWPSDF